MELIEKEKVSISEVSLAKVASEYVEYVRRLGAIHPDELGVVAMHEHIFWGPPGWEYDPYWWFSKTAAYEKAHKDLSDFRILGGNTFVDLSGLGLGRHLPTYIELSKSSGVNVVACTGFWAERGIAPFFLEKSR